MTLQRARYNVANSPSKIDQWCKPKPTAKLVLTLVRRSPLMLKERAGGSMISRQDLPLCCIVTVWPIDGIAKVRESTSKRSNASKKLIISNTMQEPRRGSQLGDIQRLMDVPRRGTSAETVALPLVILPPPPLS